jgi:hypothetical protein
MVRRKVEMREVATMCKPMYIAHSVHTLMCWVGVQGKGDFLNTLNITADTNSNIISGIA